MIENISPTWTPLRTEDVLPRVLPARWQRIKTPPTQEQSQRWYRSLDGITVGCSRARHRDGGEWLHVSFSRPDRLPSYGEMRDVKDVFVGHDRVAVQVFPKAAEHYSLHPYCLHLWCRLDRDVVPDLRSSSDGGAV